MSASAPLDFAPLLYLSGVLADLPDPAIDEWLRDGVRLWAKSEGSMTLEAALGLPAKRAPGALRAYWLHAAANQIGASSWAHLRDLAAEAQRFERRAWPCWSKNAAPPATANQLERAFFYARRTGKELPGTAQGWQKALGWRANRLAIDG